MRHELRILLREPAARLVLLVLLAASGFAVWRGAARVAQERENVRAMTAGAEARLSELVARFDVIERGEEPDGPSPVWPGVAQWATEPLVEIQPGPLAFAAAGDELWRAAFPAAGLNSAAFEAEELRSPLALLSGRFDLAFVVLFLVPLLALALAPGLGAERSAGRLPLLAAQPTALVVTLRRRALVRLLWLTTPIALALILGGLLTGGLAPLTALAWWLAATLHAAVWLLVASLVSIRSRNETAAVMTFVGLFVAFAVLVPALLDGLASRLCASESRLALVLEERARQERWQTPSPEAQALFAANYPDLRLTELSEDSRQNLAWLQTEEQTLAELGPRVSALRHAALARQRLVGALQWLSPTLAGRQALALLSGSAVERRLELLDQGADALADHRRFFVPLVLADAKLTRSDYDGIPSPIVRDDPRAFPRSALLCLALLLAICLVLTWLESRFLARLEPGARDARVT